MKCRPEKLNCFEKYFEETLSKIGAIMKLDGFGSRENMNEK
jgi:hypothetical protein